MSSAHFCILSSISGRCHRPLPTISNDSRCFFLFSLDLRLKNLLMSKFVVLLHRFFFDFPKGRPKVTQRSPKGHPKKHQMSPKAGSKVKTPFSVLQQRQIPLFVLCSAMSRRVGVPFAVIFNGRFRFLIVCSLKPFDGIRSPRERLVLHSGSYPLLMNFRVYAGRIYATAPRS